MPESLSADTLISHYRIIKKLGAGGMGEVYLAQDSNLGRKVAIKILPDRLAADEEARRRLIGEARAAAKVDHPNICTIHEVGKEGGRTFIVMHTHLAWHYHSSRQYDQAIEQCDRTFEIAPESFWRSYFLALAQEQKGLYDDAISNFQGAVTLSGNVTFAAAGLGHAYGLSGRKSEARSVLNELIRQSEQRFVPSYDIAIVQTGLGEKDQALEWLQKAYEERSGWMAYLNVEPRLDSLRADSRFSDLLARVGFAR